MTRPLAIVTGASSGIGAAVSPLLARDGYDLLLIARRAKELESLAKTIRDQVAGAQAEPLSLDVTAPGAAAKLLEKAPNAKLVLNAAGFGKVGSALDFDLDTYRRMIALNIVAITEITYLFAKRMRDNGGGTIMNIASLAALGPNPYFTVYAATKAYVLSMSEGLHFELRDQGVNVLAFCPGSTETGFNEEANMSPMVKKWMGMPVEPVAKALAAAIRDKKESVVPGLMNKSLAFSSVHFRGIARAISSTFFKPEAR